MRSYVLRAAAGEQITEEIQAQINDGLLWISFKIQPVIEEGETRKLIAEGHDISEQRRLRDNAQIEQMRVQSLLDDMQTMVAILDLDGRVTLVNNTPLIVAGLTQTDVLGLSLWECPWFTDDPHTQHAVKTDISDALTGQSTLGDIQILTPEGRLWVEFSIHPVFDEDGKVVQMVAEGRDPSARRQVQEEREQVLRDLQEREQNLAITLDSIGDAVITTDASGLITRMNPIAEHLTGWSFEEAQQLPLSSVFAIFNASTGKPLASPVDKLMTAGEIVHLSNNTTLRSRDGNEYQISDSAAPIRDKSGLILGSILVFSDVTEQYRLRQQARATQLQLQGLFDDMQTMVGIFDSKGIMTFVNNTPLLATGITREEVLGHELWEAPWFTYNPLSTATVKRDMLLATQGQSTLSDVQINTLGGELWIAFSTHPIFNDNGQVLQIVAEARDVTARKTTEMELRFSERRLRRYRDQAPLATIEWNTQHQVVGWNVAAEKLFGFTFEEVKGQFFSSLLPPTIKYEADTLWKNLIAQNGSENVRAKILTKGGETKYTRWHNAPFFDDDGNIIGAASIILDLTSEHAAQSALRNSERTQREILDSMVEGVVVTDETGAILSVNLAAEKMLGYRANELIGQQVSLLLEGQTEESFHRNMQRYLDTGDLSHIGMAIELNVICKNKNTFPTILAVAELSQADGAKRRFISSFRDLSEFKQQEEQLRRSQKMDALGKLTGGIAHDFNNMLGIVTGYADLLENALLNEKKLALYAHEIHRAGERGAKLTRKLLSFSQQTAVHADSLDINALIINQQHMLETSLTPRINLVHELAASIWPVCLDSDDLEDAIINICINAMHAIDTNGQVTIHTENVQLRSVNAQQKNLPSGDYVLLSITDNGKGMDEATKQRIFDPFYTTKGEQGTGLGLSQVYGFVERSKGAIDVSSMPGRGTQLRLYFPRDSADSDIEETNNTPIQTGLGGNETILVVDDEKKLLDLCTEILSSQGYKVLSANNCSEALQLLEGNRVDLMFSDVVMPDMDGYELALIVAEKYPTIKIQMASGFSDDRQSAMADDTLHQNLLSKPYRTQTLLSKIRELLDA
jgi:PAS domain S-box-containing protein